MSQRCPVLEHLNLMKNPCNPVFQNESEYNIFRAKCSIWIPSLKTLDGTDFNDDKILIGQLRLYEEKKIAGQDEEQKTTDTAKTLMTDKTIKA